MMTWWSRAAGSVGVLPSLLVVVGLTLVTLAGHAGRCAACDADGATAQAPFARGLYLGLIGHLFLLLLATDRTWSLPPWPRLRGARGDDARRRAPRRSGAESRPCTRPARLRPRPSSRHGARAPAIAGVGADGGAGGGRRQRLRARCGCRWPPLPRMPASMPHGPPARRSSSASCRSSPLSTAARCLPFRCCSLAHVVNLCVLLALTAEHRWPFVAVGAVVPAWVAILQWQARRDLDDRVAEAAGAVGGALRGVRRLSVRRRPPRARQPRSVPRGGAGERDGVLRRARRVRGRRARLDDRRHPGRSRARCSRVLLRSLLSLEPAGQRDLGRLALVAGAALAFVTVAIPLQLKQQWITIGWALEGAALAWVYKRIPASRALLLGRRAARRGVRPAGAQP